MGGGEGAICGRSPARLLSEDWCMALARLGEVFVAFY